MGGNASWYEVEIEIPVGKKVDQVKKERNLSPSFGKKFV